MRFLKDFSHFVTKVTRFVALYIVKGRILQVAHPLLRWGLPRCGIAPPGSGADWSSCPTFASRAWCAHSTEKPRGIHFCAFCAFCTIGCQFQLWHALITRHLQTEIAPGRLESVARSPSSQPSSFLGQ